MASDVNIRKVAPYPIAVDIIVAEGQPPLKGLIVRLTDIGFLMKVESLHFYKVAEKYQVHFVLPVVETVVNAKGKVMKTYDSIDSVQKKSAHKSYIVEMHFIDLPSSGKTSINNYLKKIGQTK